MRVTQVMHGVPTGYLVGEASTGRILLKYGVLLNPLNIFLTAVSTVGIPVRPQVPTTAHHFKEHLFNSYIAQKESY